ncbi:RNA helicase, partial [Laribacter hongkongensis]|nr:RNA helicase [Laribacter hongkongensis]
PRGGFGGHQQRREGGDDRRQFAPRQDGDAHRSGTARDGRRFDDRSSAPRGDFAPRGDRGHSWGQQRDDRRPHGGGQSREGGFRNGDRPRQGGNRNHGGRYGD